MQFSPGDRVELLVDLDHDVTKGTKGIVIDKVATNSYRVKFDGKTGETLVSGDDLKKVLK